jgi:hypothetical protein
MGIAAESDFHRPRIRLQRLEERLLALEAQFAALIVSAHHHAETESASSSLAEIREMMWEALQPAEKPSSPSSEVTPAGMQTEPPSGSPPAKVGSKPTPSAQTEPTSDYSRSISSIVSECDVWWKLRWPSLDPGALADFSSFLKSMLQWHMPSGSTKAGFPGHVGETPDDRYQYSPTRHR